MSSIGNFSHLDLGAPFFPGGHELWHHPLAYSAAAAAELPNSALQHATLVHPALHPQVPVRSYLWLNPDKLMDQSMHQVSRLFMIVMLELTVSERFQYYCTVFFSFSFYWYSIRPKWHYNIHQHYIHRQCTLIWHPVIFYQARPWLVPLEQMSTVHSTNNQTLHMPQMRHHAPHYSSQI